MFRIRPRLFVVVALFACMLLIGGCGCGSDASQTTGTVSGSASRPADGAPEEGSGKPSDPGSEKLLRKAEEFGSEATGSDAEQVEAALLGSLTAQANGEWEKACSYLTKALRRAYVRLGHVAHVDSPGCTGFIAQLTQRLQPDRRANLADVEVRSVRLKGDDGYVVYTSGSEATVSRPVKREDGEWKIGSLLVRLLAQARSSR